MVVLCKYSAIRNQIEEICKKTSKKFGESEIIPIFAIPKHQQGLQNAEIAQLVEHNLAKVGVASSSLVFRSKKPLTRVAFFYF